MPTHQSLGGYLDEEFLQRMVQSYPERFEETFWTFFTSQVATHLPPHAVGIDLGCGPGLFLRDLGERYPQMRLYGYDVTPAMVAYAQCLSTTGVRPTFAVHDATTQPLPHADGTVHLVVMTSVLHVMDEPLVVLADIRRVLTPTGLFMLHDWVRQPLSVYLARRQESIQEDPETNQRRGFRLFAVHNKYTTEDWQWLLAEAGFAIRHQAQLRPTHQMFVATPAAP
jgi:SAM-dependent methyltransferase